MVDYIVSKMGDSLMEIICFMIFAETLPILNRYKHKFMNNYMEIICFMIFAESLRCG